MHQAITSTPRALLHVGCGPYNRSRLPACFQADSWREIRLDIDPAVAPDMIGSITDLSAVPDASVDALYSSHNLEHLDSYDVPRALAEFRRVLKPDGFALVTVPDLRAVARYIASDQLDSALYQSAAGPITAIDIVFGHQAALQQGNHYMAHRTGFSARTLGLALVAAGFAEIRVHEGAKLDLWAIATMPATSAAVFEELVGVAQ